MFKINRYTYVDKKTKTRWQFYCRAVELADSMADRITRLGQFNLQRRKWFFKKEMLSKIPPYEVEQEQEQTIRGWEEENEKK